MVSDVVETTDNVMNMLNTGAVVLLAALFIVSVLVVGRSWLKSQSKREEHDLARDKEMATMNKTLATVVERNNVVLESNTRVIEGNQRVVEQVLQSNARMCKVQEDLMEEMEKVQNLNQKIYTEIRVVHAGKKDG